jgi:hypothetical protein
MILVVEHAPPLPHGVLAALLEGAVMAAASREVHGVVLAEKAGAGAPARVLIASAKTAEQARQWVAQGVSETDVIRRLHEGASGAGGAA